MTGVQTCALSDLLLNLGLQVGGVAVVLVARALKFFQNPRFEFVSISPEILESSRFFEFLSLDLGRFFEVGVSSQDLNKK